MTIKEPTIHFVQHTEDGRFDSYFKIEKTNHRYFSWQGKSLPENHELAFLESLHLVDVDKMDFMHGLANMQYYVREDNEEGLAEHLGCSQSEARDIISLMFVDVMRYEKRKEHLTRIIEGENKFLDKKKEEFGRCLKREAWRDDKQITDLNKAYFVKKVRRSGEMPDYFESLDKLDGFIKELLALNGKIDEYWAEAYRPHKERVELMGSKALDAIHELAGKTVEIGEDTSDETEDFILWIGDEKYPVTDVRDSGWSGLQYIITGDKEFYLAENRESAGKAAREYWEDMKENDKREFVSLVGEENVMAWAMNEFAGPGSKKVSSLEGWLDLWLDTPEEQWATYDGTELDVRISEALAEECGFVSNECVAYRSN